MRIDCACATSKLLPDNGNDHFNTLPHLRFSRKSSGALRINRTSLRHLRRGESGRVRDQTCCQSVVGPYVFADRSRWIGSSASQAAGSLRVAAKLDTQGLGSSCGRAGQLYEWRSGGVRDAWTSDLGRFDSVFAITKTPKPRVYRRCAVHKESMCSPRYTATRHVPSVTTYVMGIDVEDRLIGTMALRLLSRPC
jgi:hypothetical protein